MAERTCSVGGCERPHHSRGLCSRHYTTERRRAMTDLCNVPRCERIARASGLCNMHYKRLKKTGDLGQVEPLTNRITGTYEERFWARVEKTETCWLWTASTQGRGYGAMWNGERMILAHRWAYQSLVGPIPEGLELDHLCRVRNCVNPAHLEPVTRKENILRGESDPAKRARQTHCKRGHLLSGDNLYVVPPNGYRRCRECIRILQQTRAYKDVRNARLRERALELGYWPQ